MLVQLIVDKEFKALIPPLSDEEYKGLEENIVKEGCRDSIVTWEGVIVDGHNRYEICTRHNIPFNTVEKEFASRGEAIEWIILNQFGRRNLPAYDRAKLALTLKPIMVENAKARQGRNYGIQDGGLLPKKSWELREKEVIEDAKDIFSKSPDRASASVKIDMLTDNATKANRRDRMSTSANIYFMRINKNEMKVGSSTDVLNRLKQLRVAAPNIVLLENIPFGEGAKKHESKLKNKYSQYLISGEVYRYSDKLLQDMVSYTKREAARVKETDVILAKVAGVSHDTIAKVEKIEAKAPIEIKQKLRRGDISINQAYNSIKNEERKELIQKQVEEIEKGNIEKPTGLFDVIAMDPPWNYGTTYSAEGRRVANPYPEMAQDQLKTMDVPAKDNCVMFLWTTHKFIWDAKELLDTWGFTYRAMLVWDKEKIGMGDLVRMQCEFCLIGIKGKPVFKDEHGIRDIIREPRREHSRKPDAFYQLVDSLCVGNKLDYFSREQREGWSSYGNDTEKF